MSTWRITIGGPVLVRFHPRGNRGGQWVLALRSHDQLVAHTPVRASSSGDASGNTVALSYLVRDPLTVR